MVEYLLDPFNVRSAQAEGSPSQLARGRSGSFRLQGPRPGVGGYRIAGYRSGYYGVNFTYVVDGRTYDGGLVSGVELQKGDTFPLRYDPQNPSRNSSDPLPNWTRVYDVVFCALISALLVWAWLNR